MLDAQAHAVSVRVYCQDEHRVGLKPILGRVWAPSGQRPIALVDHRYEWLYVYAFSCPETGDSQFWLLPEVNTPAFQAVLDAFAQSVGASAEQPVLLVLDQAGWHVSHDLHLPDGIILVFLPSHSPELQPAERLWALTDAPLVNQCFDTLDDLQHTLARHCAALEAQPQLIQAQTRFHWWPSLAL